MTREESALMPRYARRAPPDPSQLSADPGRRRDAREVAMLEGQLSALARDIRSARSALAGRSVSVGVIRRDRRTAGRTCPRGERVRLTGGQEIFIRPIEPSDAPQLRAGFERLTAVTRYRRFLGPLDHLSQRQLRYLTRVDHVGHEALVALDGASGAGIGVARYLRDARDPQLAEVAVVVTDAWHHRGVASALLERLAERARAAGLERLTGRSILGDRAVAALATRAGAVMATRRRPGTIELTVRLVSTSAPAADASGRCRSADARRTPRETAASLRRATVGAAPAGS
jgi:GNAT superfamily N-acetyltransferase